MEESVLLVNKNMVWLRCLRADTVDINPSKYGLNIAYFCFMLFCLLLVLSSHRCVLTANLRNIYLSFAVFFLSFFLSSPFCHSCCCCSATNFSFHSKFHATTAQTRWLSLCCGSAQSDDGKLTHTNIEGNNFFFPFATRSHNSYSKHIHDVICIMPIHLLATGLSREFRLTRWFVFDFFPFAAHFNNRIMDFRILWIVWKDLWFLQNRTTSSVITNRILFKCFRFWTNTLHTIIDPIDWSMER